MKKGKKIVVVIVLFLAVLYFGVKGYLLWSISTQDDYINEIQSAFDQKNTISIQSVNISKEEYFNFEGLKIRNDFEIYDEEYNVYTIQNSDIKIVFSKTPIDDLVTVVKEESKKMGLHYDLTKDLEKNNVNTNYKLYEYLLENTNPKLNIFSSINTFRKAHAIDLSSDLVFRSFNQLTLINGDYDGYILQTNGSKTVIINHNSYSYYITISSGYSDEDLYSLLSTITFD